MTPKTNEAKSTPDWFLIYRADGSYFGRIHSTRLDETLRNIDETMKPLTLLQESQAKAAPDLLEALQKFHDQVHDIAGESLLNWRAKLQLHCEEARAALAKATKGR